ncbi:MAG: SpoIIIAH-like family protein [Bacilli bacterium]|nr:SpoIIIAH-like family protein [Bacilli bacterium]
MINKQSLWFLTLFSLILVLSVYYITMPNDLLISNNGNYLKTEETNKEIDDVKTTIKESELLVTMRVNLEEEREKEVKDLKSTLTNEEATSEEKNNAYEQIKLITNLSSREKELEKKIKEKFDIDSFVKIKNNDITVVAVKNTHDVNLANSIMRLVQEAFDQKVSVTISFQK